jgi:hypothetical protein
MSIRRLLASAVLALVLCPNAGTAAPQHGPTGGKPQQVAEKDDIDSEHLFGFTEGSDIGDKGDREAEVEPVGRFGKRGGTYAATSIPFLLKYTAFDNFRVAPFFSLASHNIANVPGLTDVSRWTLEGVGGEVRYRLLDRQKDPIGLTLSVSGSRNRVDEATGLRAEQYGLQFLALIDRDLIPNRLFAALNLSYEPGWTRLRPTPEWERDATVGMSGALSAQVAPGWFLGLEARYFRRYDGIGLDTFLGEALFVGPTFYVKLPNRWFMSGAWNLQVAGRAVGETGSLDLINFERHEATLKIGTGF